MRHYFAAILITPRHAAIDAFIIFATLLSFSILYHHDHFPPDFFLRWRRGGAAVYGATAAVARRAYVAW